MTEMKHETLQSLYWYENKEKKAYDILNALMCSENHSNKEIVPKCNVCGLVVRDLEKPIKDGMYYRRQIQGLLLIIEDSGGEFSCEYMEEKLKAIILLDKGINFHPGILHHLDNLYNPRVKKNIDGKSIYSDGEDADN